MLGCLVRITRLLPVTQVALNRITGLFNGRRAFFLPNEIVLKVIEWRIHKLGLELNTNETSELYDIKILGG